MKKVISIILALALILGMSVTVLADDPQDASTVTVTKNYTLVGNGSSPAETFTLVQVGNGVVKDGDAQSAPALGTITGAQFAAGDAAAAGTEKDITIALPTYTKTGVYEYTLQEVAGTNAGVTYYDKTMKLVVTVINDGNGGLIRQAAVHTEETGDKSDTFENTYSAGALSLTKTVTGNLGDKSKYFKFTVTLTGDGESDYADSFAVTGGSMLVDGKTACAASTIAIDTPKEFYLKDGETLTIANIPYGVTYEIVEADYSSEDYVTTPTNDEGEISDSLTEASFVNNKEKEVDTGVILDSIPFIVLFAAAVFGMVVVFRKKRLS